MSVLPTISAALRAQLNNIRVRLNEIVLGQLGWPSELDSFGDFLQSMLDVSRETQSALVAVVPDATAQRVAAALLTSDDVVHLYAAPAGSDTTGDGSPSKPFATITRAAVVCQQASTINSAMKGNVVIHWPPAVDHPPGIFFPRVPCSGVLCVVVVDDVPIDVVTLSTGTQPPNPDKAGEVIASSYEYTQAHTAVIGKQTHYLVFNVPVGSGFVPFGALLDGVNCGPGKLTVLERFDVSLYGVAAEVRPYTSRIVGSNPTTGGPITVVNDNAAGNPSFQVFFAGFQLGEVTGDDSQHFSTLSQINFYPCSFKNIAWAVVDADHAFTSQYIDWNDKSFHEAIGGEFSTWHSLFSNVPSFTGALGEMSIGGIFEGEDGSSNGAYIGGATPGRAGGGAAELEFGHHRAPGPIVVVGGAVRIGNHGPYSVQTASHLVHAIKGARINTVHVSGGTHGPCFFFESDAFGGSEIANLAGHLVNVVDAGKEVQVDDLTVSFANVSASRGVHGDGPHQVAGTTTDDVTKVLATVAMVDTERHEFLLDAVAESAAGAAALQRRAIVGLDGGVPTVAKTALDVLDAGLGGSPIVDVTAVGGTVSISVTGLAATTVRWEVRLTIIERSVLA